MKKIFLSACVIAALASCDNKQNDSTTTVTSDTSATANANMETVNVSSDTSTRATTGNSGTMAYTPGDGDVMLRDGHVMLWRNGTWEAATGDVTLENGVVVSKTGEVRSEGKSVRLAEGEAVNKSGNFFDRTGHAMDNAWDATKHGVSTAAEKTGDALKDVGQAIGKGAKKVGQKTKQVVNDIKN